ncbi:FtsX-like permease family protein [Streptomyces sp. NRRL WC-3549]|uniref:FtsX-like permease family protein n=1 Tax=Streptomyces sp. NRRL WC-3549 TaxID=1463925 RepID=UPI0004CC3F45|nr:FtsX-like permease family protein [Streptomyces sp. NRRL WC-3549]
MGRSATLRSVGPSGAPGAGRAKGDDHVRPQAAATAHRRAEFGRQRLAGATPRQVLGAVGVEASALTLTGLLLGTAAGAAGAIPFIMVRTGQVLPGEGPGSWPAVVTVAVAVTLGTTLGTTRTTPRTQAVDAVAVAT